MQLIISKKAKLGENVKIGPWTIIEDDVEIGDGTQIASNVFIDNGARLGQNCRIFPSAIIAAEPQDLKYAGEKTFVYIGDRTQVREFATIHRGTSHTYKTIIGTDCLIMAYCHVAHDCHLGNHIIMSNAVQLGGHVTIQDRVNIGGVAKIHQFSKICTCFASSQNRSQLRCAVLISKSPIRCNNYF